MARKDLTASAKVLAWRLADHHNQRTGQCNPSLPVLSKGTGTSRSVVAANLVALRDAGLIEWATGNSAGSNRYTLQGVTIHDPKAKPASRPSPAPEQDNDPAPETVRPAGPLPSGPPDCPTVRPAGPQLYHSEHSQENSMSPPTPSRGGRRQTGASRSGSRTDPAATFTPMPEGFILDERRTQIAGRNGVSRGEVKPVWAQFVAFNRSNGRTSADWEAAWVAWCLEATRRRKPPESRKMAV